MIMVDFTEIPSSNNFNGKQDLFELFACSFLESLGFKIISGPNRGPDDGIDILISEPTGITNCDTLWIVSVKHYAHSAKSIGVRDELDITDRVNQAGAEGFLAFYSTIPSAALERKLIILRKEGKIKKYYIYDSRKISHALTTDNRLISVLSDYFPKSYKMLKAEQNNNRLLLSAWTGMNMSTEKKVPIEVNNFVDMDENGIYRVADPEMEVVMVACLIAQNISVNNYDILKLFVSFNHKTWKHLRVFLLEGIVNDVELSNAILKSEDSLHLRLLILIAGHSRAYKAVDSICKQLLFRGRSHEAFIREMGYLITPFFEVVKNSLVQLSSVSKKVIAGYASKAKEEKKWKEYKVFKYSIK